MPNSVSAIPATAPAPDTASDPPKPAAAAPASTASPSVRPPFTPTEVAYVKSLMGVMPAQNLEMLLLKTGIPLPVNLGHGADTAA